MILWEVKENIEGEEIESSLFVALRIGFTTLFPSLLASYSAVTKCSSLEEDTTHTGTATAGYEWRGLAYYLSEAGVFKLLMNIISSDVTEPVHLVIILCIILYITLDGGPHTFPADES